MAAKFLASLDRYPADETAYNVSRWYQSVSKLVQRQDEESQVACFIHYVNMFVCRAASHRYVLQVLFAFAFSLLSH